MLKYIFLVLSFVMLLINLFFKGNNSFSYLSELLGLKLFLLTFLTFYFFIGGEFYFIFLLSLNLSFMTILVFYWVFLK